MSDIQLKTKLTKQVERTLFTPLLNKNISSWRNLGEATTYIQKQTDFVSSF